MPDVGRAGAGGAGRNAGLLAGQPATPSSTGLGRSSRPASRRSACRWVRRSACRWLSGSATRWSPGHRVREGSAHAPWQSRPPGRIEQFRGGRIWRWLEPVDRGRSSAKLGHLPGPPAVPSQAQRSPSRPRRRHRKRRSTRSPTWSARPTIGRRPPAGQPIPQKAHRGRSRHHRSSPSASHDQGAPRTCPSAGESQPTPSPALTPGASVVHVHNSATNLPAEEARPQHAMPRCCAR